MSRIAVVGAGVIGLSTAIKIKEKYPDLDVVIISKDFTPNTTGDGSGGLWYPYLVGNTPLHLLHKWGIETYKYLHELWLEGGHNICLIPVYALFYQAKPAITKPEWTKHVLGYTEMDEKLLSYYNNLFSQKYVHGHTFTTFVVPPQLLLPYFIKRFKKAGGRIVQDEVTSFKDTILESFDVIINCSGLGARTLVPDNGVYPVRGQVMKVDAPWLNHVIQHDDDNYIIPNHLNCVMGGTRQRNDFDRKPRDEDTKFIVDGCTTILPGLKDAKVWSNWVGLRPGRNEARVEADSFNGKLLIHSYGHGGSGFTLFWGSATEVLQILEEKLPLKRKNFSSVSKL